MVESAALGVGEGDAGGACHSGGACHLGSIAPGREATQEPEVSLALHLPASHGRHRMPSQDETACNDRYRLY